MRGISIFVVAVVYRTESVPVPTPHGFRRNHNEGLLPSGPESADGDPEELVDQVYSWPRVPTFQDGELLTQRQILE